MKQVISWVKNLQFNRVLTLFIVGLTFFISITVGYFGDALPAQAAPIKSETGTYPGSRSELQTRVNAEPAKGASGGLGDSIKNTAETVREKLNLDEPLPEGTKAFFKQVQGEDVKVEEPRPSGKGEEPKNH